MQADLSQYSTSEPLDETRRDVLEAVEESSDANQFDDIDHDPDCRACDGTGVREVATVNGKDKIIPCFIGMINTPWSDEDE